MTSVRTVSTKRAAKQFARGHRGALLHFDPRVRQHRVERRRELTGPIADEEPKPGDMLAEVHDEIASLLGRPRAVRMSGHAQHVHVALPESNRQDLWMKIF